MQRMIGLGDHQQQIGRQWGPHCDCREDGEQRGKADAGKLTALVDAIRRVDFFALDERGRLHPKPECRRRRDKVAACDLDDDIMCSDTSSTIIEIAHGREKHKISLMHCESLPADELETAIDAAAQTTPWVLGSEE